MNFFTNPGFILRLAIALGYVALGIVILINSGRVDFISPGLAILLGALLLAYGLFRAYRAYRFVKDEEDA